MAGTGYPVKAPGAAVWAVSAYRRAASQESEALCRVLAWRDIGDRCGNAAFFHRQGLRLVIRALFRNHLLLSLRNIERL
ncbi:hypothetical protein D3C85_1876000 [compost metagenome]